jgi:hypothetical protein
MRSPIGEGALRGFPPSQLIVSERWGLFEKGASLGLGLTAVGGGAREPGGGEEVVSSWGLEKVALLRESLRPKFKRLVPR